MKTCAWPLAALVTSVAFADSLAPIGWRETGGVAVPEGETKTITAPLVVGSGGTFVKAGEGTLEMPSAALKVAEDAKGVLEGGTLRLTTGKADSLHEPACMQKAAAWFVADAAKITTKETAGVAGAIDCWYDVRETDIAAPTRQYLKHEVGTDKSDTADNQQTIGTFQGQTGVYFGGENAINKFGYMGLYNADGSAAADIPFVYAAFYVEGVEKYHMNVISSTSDPNDFFLGGQAVAVGKESYYYCRGDSVPGAFTARHYRNGEAFDPFYTTVTAGLTVMAANFVDRPALFGALGSQRRVKCANKSTGGDYIHEVVVFTNKLSDAEVESVNRYLMQKWRVNSPSLRAKIGVGANAVVEIPVASSMGYVDYTNQFMVALDGVGLLRKTGAGRLALAPELVRDFTGTLRLESGSVHSRFAMIPPLAVEDGKTYKAETVRIGAAGNVGDGELVSVSSAAAGSVVKAGDDNLAFASIPKTVSKLEVRQGTLALVGIPSIDVYPTNGAISATFDDPRVESFQAVGQTLNERRYQIGKGMTVGGWTRPAGTDGNVGILVAPAISSGYWEFEVPEGNQAIYMWNLQDASPDSAAKRSEIYTWVDFPVAGEYLVSWRETRGYYGCSTDDRSHAYHVLMGDDWASATKIEDRIAASGFYPRVYLRLTVAKPGRQAFGFCIDDNGGGNYYSVSMDDFRADYVVTPEDASNVVKIPNGDFEDVYIDGAPDKLASATTSVSPTIRNKATGWTFHQGDNWQTGNDVSVFLASPAVPAQRSQRTKASGPYTRFSRIADKTCGTFQLFMSYLKGSHTTGGVKYEVDLGGNNYAETTFTVEEPGTYFLRGKVARWNVSYGGCDYLGQGGQMPTIEATVTIGGETTSLGAVVGDTILLSRDRLWTMPFVVAEANASVTLRLTQTQANAGGLVDDLVLVRQTDEAFLSADDATREYVTDGSFESIADTIGESGGADHNKLSTWTRSTTTTADAVGSIGFWAGFSSGNQYTLVPYDGKLVCNIRGDASISQQLPHMRAGKYRLSFAASTRQGSWDGYGGNGVRATLESPAGEIVQTLWELDSITNFDARLRTAEFTLAEAGSYVLRFKGTKAGKQGPVPATLSCVVDGISIKKIVDVPKTVPSVPKDLRITVAEGAKLNLDFKGKITVRTLKLGGTGCIGPVSAATHPDYITGDGEIEVEPHGMTILLR